MAGEGESRTKKRRLPSVKSRGGTGPTLAASGPSPLPATPWHRAQERWESAARSVLAIGSVSGAERQLLRLELIPAISNSSEIPQSVTNSRSWICHRGMNHLTNGSFDFRMRQCILLQPTQNSCGL